MDIDSCKLYEIQRMGERCSGLLCFEKDIKMRARVVFHKAAGLTVAVRRCKDRLGRNEKLSCLDLDQRCRSETISLSSL